MGLHNETDPIDSQDIKAIDKPPAKRYIPYFVLPCSACGQHQTQPDERLLDGRTPPYYMIAMSFGETDDIIHQRNAFAGQTEQPMDSRRRMARQCIKERRDGHSPQRYIPYSCLGPVNRQFPYRICRHKRDGKYDKSSIRSQ